MKISDYRKLLKSKITKRQSIKEVNANKMYWLGVEIDLIRKKIKQKIIAKAEIKHLHIKNNKV